MLVHIVGIRLFYYYNFSLPLPPPPFCLYSSPFLSLGKLSHNIIWHFVRAPGLIYRSDDSRRFWGIWVVQIQVASFHSSQQAAETQELGWKYRSGVPTHTWSPHQPSYPFLLSFISFLCFPSNLLFNKYFGVQLFFRWNASHLVIYLWLLSCSTLLLSCPSIRHDYVPGTGLDTSYAFVHLILTANLWSLGAFHGWCVKKWAQKIQ